MASTEQVKHYIAHWFLLGKKVLLPRQQQSFCPSCIFEGNSYSQEFERCWSCILNAQEECYLEGTEQTIGQLLSPRWEITDCARCQMPIPMVTAGVKSTDCPCCDLDSWPNTELPSPRPPVDNNAHYHNILKRLGKSE